MALFAIRHKPTGHYLPAFTTKQRAGGTHKEPTADCIPRLFLKPAHAQASLRQWAKGRLLLTMYTDFYGDHSQNWEWEPTPHRIPADMEIVPVKIEVIEI